MTEKIHRLTFNFADAAIPPSDLLARLVGLDDGAAAGGGVAVYAEYDAPPPRGAVCAVRYCAILEPGDNKTVLTEPLERVVLLVTTNNFHSNSSENDLYSSNKLDLTLSVNKFVYFSGQMWWQFFGDGGESIGHGTGSLLFVWCRAEGCIT